MKRSSHDSKSRNDRNIVKTTMTEEKDMTKPYKCMVMCADIWRSKMLFPTKEKAEGFIKYNGYKIIEDPSKLRVYFCPSCCGYHISSHKKTKTDDSRTDNMITAYRKLMTAHIKRRSKVDERKITADKILDTLPKEVESNQDFKKWVNEIAANDDRLKNDLYLFGYQRYPHIKKQRSRYRYSCHTTISLAS